MRFLRGFLGLGLTIAIVTCVAVTSPRAEINPVLALFLGYSKAVNAVALSANGRQAASGGQDNVLRLWDIPTGLLLRTFDAQANRINSVAFSPDGREILTGGGDRPNPALGRGRGADRQKHGRAHGRGAFGCGLGRWPASVVWEQGQHGQLWDIASGQLLKTFEGHSDEVLAVAFSGDGRQALSGSKDKTLRLWDLETGQPVKTFEGHADAVTSAALSSDGGRALSASRDKTVKLWDAASGQLLKTFEGHSGEVLSAAFSRDNRRILSASKDNTLKLWDAEDRRASQNFRGAYRHRHLGCYLSDGRLAVSGSWDKTIKVWGLEAGELQNTIDLQSVTFSPSGTATSFLACQHQKSRPGPA